MTRARVRLDSAGSEAILRSLTAEVKAAAEAVAEGVNSMNITVGDRDGGSHEYDLPVVVRSSVTDRAKSSVSLAHPAGQSVQAKHGALTKAAAQAGLDVKGY